MTPSTDLPAQCGLLTRARHIAFLPSCATAPSGSTTTTPTCRKQNGAGSRCLASAVNSAHRDSRNTSSPSTSTKLLSLPLPVGFQIRPAANKHTHENNCKGDFNG